MENIDKFNYYVALIFARLQRKFPERINVTGPDMLGGTSFESTIDAAGRYTGKYLVDGEVQDLRNDLDFLWATTRWLIDTGYLIGSAENGMAGRGCHVTLSPKALEVLKAAPSSISAERSLGDDLEEAMSSAAKDKLAEIAGTGLTWLFKVGWGAVGAV